MNVAVETARRGGILGQRIAGSAYAFDIEVRVGAGVCGKETSLVESIEGKRGVARAKPLRPAHSGLFGPRPSSATFCPSHPFRSFWKRRRLLRRLRGWKIAGNMPVQLAGNVKYGGLFETAFGMTLGELVDM